jgi:outer membrane protein assembly factor BamD (BamD/ComL family)
LAKQQRHQSAAEEAERPARRGSNASRSPSPQPKNARAAAAPLVSGSDQLPGSATTKRSTYVDAVTLYEQAIRTLQQHNFAKAADLLSRMVAGFPDERELIERSRMYLTLCERQLRPLTAEPQNTAERLYAATLAVNAGKPEEAVRHLERILKDEPAHDQALYMLAVSHAQRDEVADAIRYLQQAIEANPENRALARLDPDLDDLRDDDAVSELLESPLAMRAADPKRSARRK